MSEAARTPANANDSPATRRSGPRLPHTREEWLHRDWRMGLILTHAKSARNMKIGRYRDLFIDEAIWRMVWVLGQ